MSQYAGSDRQVRNDESRLHAEHHTEHWSRHEDEWLALWDGTERTLAELAEILGRTIEACRQRYYLIQRADSITYTETTTTRRQGQVTSRTHTSVTVRPKWMDDEGLPEWYRWA